MIFVGSHGGRWLIALGTDERVPERFRSAFRQASQDAKNGGRP